MQDEVAESCRSAKIGCGDCKNMLTETMLEGMRPIMEKRNEIVKKPKDVEEIIAEGTKKAQLVATSTLDRAKQAMKFK
jgi:tryptophanyl-tRNA synthetase